MKLSAQGQLDVQAQARTLVTIAVIANLLLAFVLSMLLVFGVGEPVNSMKPAEQTSLEHSETPLTADLRGMRFLPKPSDW